MKTKLTYSICIFFVMSFILPGCKKSSPVLIPVKVPAINTISPTSGIAGTVVTISGANFSATAADNTVKFNGTDATVTSATAGKLTVTAPAAASTGAITVTTAGGTATGPVFTYLLAPTIATISPVSAKAGTAITITGTNFDATAANNTVKFNGVAAAITSATTTKLVVTAPAAATSGAVTVATSGGTATGPVFTFIVAPTITAINPTSAAEGASVTITGTDFDAVAANNTVKFNGTTASVTTANTTQLVVKVPTGGSSGNVTVTTVGGTSNGIAFTYTATGPTVYVLGSDTRSGYGWWKNSSFTAIPSCTSAYAMVGSGTDIYIAGPTTANVPTYWKNGTAVQLSSQTGYTFSIVVSGTDVYCLGQINGTYYVWKNGTATQLTTTTVTNIGGSGTSNYLNNALAVSNGDTYVAGARYLGTSTILKATYWKNGTPIDITDGIHSGNAQATAICVSGGAIYIAGFEEIRDPASGGIINKAPRLWKNGISIPLTTPGNSLFNSVSSILVSGGDVYVGGQYNGAGAVWKNGTMLTPSAYAVAENVSSLFLYNNTDLYIGGASSSSGENGYWKNGDFVEMDPGCTILGPGCARTSANQVISLYVK
ncbi:IPT/TIG domain-containing protein [Mucilaginibacter ginsenosidivorax]|uniref:IPT/TIG domain-containing protein n=1 Tax=Mucilaginibacter ginsenosidivorax TaxID=862126 RepID=A0A5B8W1R4_9SPHI|nr:IPT/TIG domain-containing protein [Mucilaginibacter ginsenosidivorax]QEC77653.1 hypothetical protein FSB76_17530 [Mucilaginibacter ginsenosidivorax]